MHRSYVHFLAYPAFFALLLLVLPLPFKEFTRHWLMKLLFHKVYVGIKMTLFRLIFLVSTLVFLGACLFPPHALHDTAPPLPPTDPHGVACCGVLCFLAACSDGAMKASSRYQNADVLQAQLLLGRKWRAERNWWISASALMSWIVVYRLNTLLKQIKAKQN